MCLGSLVRDMRMHLVKGSIIKIECFNRELYLSVTSVEGG